MKAKSVLPLVFTIAAFGSGIALSTASLAWNPVSELQHAHDCGGASDPCHQAADRGGLAQVSSSVPMKWNCKFPKQIGNDVARSEQRSSALSDNTDPAMRLARHGAAPTH